MTTIAYKDGVIAYDSRMTMGSLIKDDNCDKRIDRDDIIFFLAGDVGDEDEFIDAILAESAEHDRDLHVHGLMVKSDKLYEIGMDEDCKFWKIHISYGKTVAIGTGGEHALTAMDMGASAIEAVYMAGKRDTNTGGTIRVYGIGRNV
ncbi:hypothetical protein [Pseudoalteromonas sp.]|uniref:hypothetical protein n=1 Tax=Pseudoalteromonas sp. TaxID=53249 RepID=UPI00261794C6|nr:hypothetical protein [Pseudoalteromonas sp.]MCP4585337.1 proteasome subunit beta [Pseudoalteromonas sp.]